MDVVLIAGGAAGANSVQPLGVGMIGGPNTGVTVMSGGGYQVIGVGGTQPGKNNRGRMTSRLRARWRAICALFG